MLNNKHTFKYTYIYICNNTLKFLKNEEIGVIKC